MKPQVHYRFTTACNNPYPEPDYYSL
jgi:hypothetical protein